MANELERIRLLARILGGASAGVDVGIGDDAAVLSPGAAGERLVWTVDAQVEGTHFRRAWLSWEDVGFRSFMAAASDVAAMGARAACALSSLVLPSAFSDDDLAAFARGQGAAAAIVGAPVVGGNLARGSEFSVTTTVLGRALAPIERRGATPGDRLYLAGTPGLAAAGLEALALGDVDHASEAVRACVDAWRRPTARMNEGASLATPAIHPHVHAAIDVSDGLARDASHLADASDVTVVFDAGRLLAVAGSSLHAASLSLAKPALDFILYGGEDYVLLVASDVALPGFVDVGSVEARAGVPSSVALRTSSGLEPIDARGFDHFAATSAGAQNADGGGLVEDEAHRRGG